MSLRIFIRSPLEAERKPLALADIYAEHNLGISRAGVSQSNTKVRGARRRLALKRKLKGG